MFPGQLTLCLKTKDLPGMRRFYEALGMKVHIEEPNFVLLNNGDVDIALMTFLDEHSLNFRGADVFEIYKRACATGLELEGKPESYKREQYDADADGENWLTHDPDGNNIFFDTNEGEIGEKGHALALQRVLDGTAKQLVNVGASAACADVFQAKIMDRFMPTARRAQTRMGLDTSALTEPRTFAGHFSLCLKTKDNIASRNFYEAIGLEVRGAREGGWVQLDNGDCHIDLMSFLGENWLNFRGADVFKLYEGMTASGFELEGKPVRYTSEEMGRTAPGAHWSTKDPDGNVVYFDTTDPELIEPGAPAVLNRVLERTLRQLENIGAEDACLHAFKTEVMGRFAS